jgi:hypothetical protein
MSPVSPSRIVSPLEGVLFEIEKVSQSLCVIDFKLFLICWHEELAYKILSSLPRSRLAAIHRRIAPLLKFDLVGVRPFSDRGAQFTNNTVMLVSSDRNISTDILPSLLPNPLRLRPRQSTLARSR